MNITSNFLSSLRTIGLAAVAVSMFAGLAGAADLKAKLGISTWIGYTPLYIAIEKGYFKDQGLDLEIVVFNGNEAQTAFAAGRLDGFTTSGDSLIVLANQGKDFKIVHVTDFSEGGDGILARNTVKDLADVKGRRIAVQEIAVSHFYLLFALAKVGLKESDVTLVNLSPDAAAAAYQSGQVDVAVTWAPYLGQVNRQVKEGRIIHDTSKAPGLITDFYLFDTQFIKDNPKAVKAFVKGVFRGLEYFKANRKEGLAIAAKRLEVTPEALAEDLKGIAIPDVETNVAAIGDPKNPMYVVNTLEPLAKFLVEKKQVKKAPDMSKYIDATFVLEIQKEGL